MGGPAPTELRLEFRDLTTNMVLRNGFSNTLRWSPMPGAALSTTLLDPLQRPGACNGCRPAPPEQREQSERQYSCSACKVQKTRDDYWPEEFDNRAIAKKLVCKRCRPTPPAQRQQKKQSEARSKSAGAVL